tara:strand:+ start:640 stop:1035 length:396 start_codon:yes stop_codon:yes gene_type:complete
MVHFSERTYYEDPEENETFINVYGSFTYCKHGQPCYCKCYRCIDEKTEKLKSQYKKKQANFNYKDFFNFDEKPYENEKEFIELRQSTTIKELKKRYHKLCLINHPDKNGDEETFKRLNNLYHELLKDMGFG